MDFDRHMASMDYGEGSMMALMRGGGVQEQHQTGHHHDFMRSNMGYNNASSSTVASSNINEQQTHPNINSEPLYQSAMYQAYYPNHLGSHHLMHPPQTQTGDNNAPIIATLPNQAMEGAFRLSESDALRAQIMSHPQYPQLVTAYANCQKVGAPPEVVAGLDEISKEYQNHLSIRPALTGYGVNPELDRFMEEYCNVLHGYHEELTKPFKEAMSFFRKVELQLNSLSKGTVRLSSSGEGQDKDAANASSEEEEGSCGEIEFHDVDPLAEEAKLKEQLLRKYSGYICTLKQEFLKKKKKGKLPKEARQKLLDWWNQHYKWPYPSETEKSGLAESTGLDQKQINNWFINQRKRHWKPSEDMHYAMDSPNSGAAHHHHPHHYQHHPYHHNPFNDSTPFKTEMGLIPMDQF